MDAKGAYDSHRIMLDPGLTALALRGLHKRDGLYPFIDRFTRRHRSRGRAVRACPSQPSSSRWPRVVQWFLGRHRSAVSA